MSNLIFFLGYLFFLFSTIFFSTEAINERIRFLNHTLEKKIDLQIIDLEEDGTALDTKIILQFPI